MKTKERKKKEKQLTSLMIILISFLLIYIGNKVAMKDVSFFDKNNDLIVAKAKVTQIVDPNVNEYGTIIFECNILEGENAGSTVTAGQIIDPDTKTNIRTVEEGDVVYLADASQYEIGADLFLYEYERFNGMVWLGAAFAVLLMLFGRSKGLRTIISLVFTCATIFLVFIPAIIAGYNVYLSSIVTCVFVIIMTLLIVQGPNAKTMAAVMGCLGGLLIVSLLTVGMSEFLNISGLMDEDSYFLLYLDTPVPINLRAVVFAAITIGAMGAILDIAVDISASLSEVHRHASKISLNQTLRSGITIGQDIVGSMANTLILAYIGSSLSMILLLLVHSGSIQDLFNSELITVEILQALAGSIGILFTIPITSFSCGILYNMADSESEVPEIRSAEEEAQGKADDKKN